VIQPTRKFDDIVDNFSLATRAGRAALVVPGAGTLTSDLSYYRRRASEERTAALNSRDIRVRRVHMELAERYESRVRGMATHHEQIYFPMVEPA
jgi:hypothetical protein